MKKRPKNTMLLVTVGSGGNKITATFFNARYIKKVLTEGTKVMLSASSGFIKARCS